MESTSVESPQVLQKIPLYSNGKVEVFIPENPNTPITEGLQVQAEGTEPEKRNDPKNILLRNLYSIMAAKVIAEGSQTPEEAWANTRIEEDNTVNAYGRNALNPDSWRKPVDAHDRNAPEITTLPEPYDQEKLQRLFGSYMHKWEETVDKITLFDVDVKDQPIDTTENTDGDQIIWQSESYAAKIIKNPHIKGIHIVVDAKFPPGGEFPRQWMTRAKKGDPLDPKYVKMTLETTAIALGIRELLGQGKGEIHNSGNWARGLKSTNDGGSLNEEALKINSKQEKRAHRPDVADNNDFDTSMHVHVYIPDEGKVFLPSMPLGEAQENAEKSDDKTAARKALETWNNLPKTTQDQVASVRTKLADNILSSWLITNTQGRL